MFVNADNTWSFDQLLQTPLPVHPAANRSRSVSQKDKDRCTHPTSVQHWHNWEADVKQRLQQADIQVNKSLPSTYRPSSCHGTKVVIMSASNTYILMPGHNSESLLQALRAAGSRYNIIGLHSYAYEVNEAGASSALYWNACLRLNQLFAEHGSLKSFQFTKQRTTAKTDSQVISYTVKWLGVALQMHCQRSL